MNKRLTIAHEALYTMFIGFTRELEKVDMLPSKQAKAEYNRLIKERKRFLRAQWHLKKNGNIEIKFRKKK